MRMLRIQAVMEMTGLSKPTIYRLMHNGQFPQSIKLSPHATGWLDDDIEAYLRVRIEHRDQAQKALRR